MRESVGASQNKQSTSCLYRSPNHVEGSTLCYGVGKRESVMKTKKAVICTNENQSQQLKGEIQHLYHVYSPITLFLLLKKMKQKIVL